MIDIIEDDFVEWTYGKLSGLLFSTKWFPEKTYYNKPKSKINLPIVSNTKELMICNYCGKKVSIVMAVEDGSTICQECRTRSKNVTNNTTERYPINCS